MDLNKFSQFWSAFNIFGRKNQETAVPTSRVDFSQAEHYDIGGLNSRRSLSTTSVYSHLEGTKTRTLLYKKRGLGVQTLRSFAKEQPRVSWKKFRLRGEKRASISDPVTLDLEPNDEVIGLDPPSKKPKMESTQFQNGSTFNDSKGVQIVKIVNSPKTRADVCTLPSKPTLKFKRSIGKSTVIQNEERREEKRKYSELLQRHVYSNIKRGKAPVITLDKVGLAMKVLQSPIFGPKNAEGLAETVDLTETTLAQRVQVNRQRSVTPVTQATEKPNDSAENRETKRRSSSFLSRKPEMPYLQPDFIANFKEMHLRTQKSLQEEAESLKKKVEMHSRINIAARKQNEEKAMESLNKRIHEYLKVTESFPEEEEVEVVPPLPVLSDEMEKAINAALARGNPGEVLANAFNLKINRRDIQTLQELNWLNDEVINFYMNLLMDRGKQDKYPSVYAFNTFFYPKLVSGGHSVLKRWTKKVDIFSYDFVVAPVHLGVHWCMAIIDMGKKSIMYFDSMGGPNQQCLTALKKYLCDEMMDKKKEKLDITQWEVVCMKDIPQQMNGSDCGMFSCMYAEYTVRRAPISFTQEDMPYFRRKMIYEIIKVKLLC